MKRVQKRDEGWRGRGGEGLFLKRVKIGLRAFGGEGKGGGRGPRLVIIVCVYNAKIFLSFIQLAV